MNNLKLELERELRIGKPKSWIEAYNKYPFKGTLISNKSKSDTVRNMYKSLRKRLTVQNHDAKILLFDIETSPLSAYVWRCWKQNIHPTSGQLKNNYFVLCWSAKWLFKNKVMSMTLTPEEAVNEDDERIVKGIWDLLEEADIVIAHFGDKFDIPMINGRFLQYRLGPPSPYKSIDTCRHASKSFRLPSNKLDYLASMLGKDNKDSTEFMLWKECLEGNKKALRKMNKYCDKDVRILEDVYLELRPWIKPHPQLGFFVTEGVTCCPTCGNTDLIQTGSKYRTYVSEYTAFRCNDCQSIFRDRKNSTHNKKNLLVSTPK